MTATETTPFVVSPCSNPDMELEPVLKAYRDLGFQHIELFTGWAKSSVDYTQNPQDVQSVLASYGITPTSLHLPAIDGENFDETVANAAACARFADALGVEVVLFKAKTREAYIKGAKPFLDATQDLTLTPVLQNHAGTAISTLADFDEVITGINDGRMKTLLEVGHFFSVGVTWQEGLKLLGDSIALIHIKDQVAKQSVPFGTGDIDLKGLFDTMAQRQYAGRYVIEMEVQDKENTLTYLGQALAHAHGLMENN